jgi:AraC-like DNA-binding protein
MENKSTPCASYTASIPALRQYLQMAERAEVDVRSILDAAGLTQSVVSDNTQRIPLEQFEDILQGLINASGDPLFGFHTSEFIEPAFYSVHGYITLNCSTLKETLATIPVYEKIVGDMGVSDVQSQGDSTVLRWNSQLTNPLVKRHVRENIICSWFRFTETFLRVEGSPNEIWFEHEAPESIEQLEEYQTLFGCEVLFSRPYTGIWIDNAKLNEPIAQADEKLLHALFDHASQLLSEIDKGSSLAEQIKSMLRLTLNNQIPSSELIADKLGISVRTLQRKLGEEGTSYKAVLSDLRKELALHYVKNTSLSLEVIAAKLGFSETRSFYRSFKQWTGTTASTYRQTP